MTNPIASAELQTLFESYYESFYDVSPRNSDTDFETIHTYFYYEYLGSKGLSYEGGTLVGTVGSDETERANVLAKWNSYIAGGDPFGYHNIGTSALFEAASWRSSVDLSIVWDLYDKLIELLEAIQNAAISLSDGVKYTTQTQKAITDEMSAIQFPTSDTHPEAEDRQEAQAAAQQKLDNLRALRSVEKDTSKQWSSSMSGANEASQQQTQILSALVQQMSSLVSTIFR